MQFHDAANIFPLDDEHLDELAEDIKEHGLQIPIEQMDGKIIDGRRRWLACKKAGVRPDIIPVSVEDPIAYVMSLNLHRRHLTPSQRSMVGARAKEHYERLAKERQKERKGKQPGATSPEKLPELSTGDTRDQAGKAVGVSGRMIDHASKVIEEGVPELVQAVWDGEVSVATGSRIAKLPAEEQQAAITGGKKAVKAAAQRVRRNEEKCESISGNKLATLEELSTIVDTPPAREAHVRPLLNVPEEHRPKVWQEAVKSAPPGPDGKPRITARCVERAVEDWHRTRLPPRDQVIDVESLPVEVPKQISVPPGGDQVRCRCCGRDVEPDDDGDCPLCHEPEIALRMPEREELTPRGYLDDDGQVVAVIHGLNDRWISARGRHRVKSPLLPPRATWHQAQTDLDTYAFSRAWHPYETNQSVAAEEPPVVEEGQPLEDRPEWFAEVERLAREAIESEGAAAVANRLEQLAANILLG